MDGVASWVSTLALASAAACVGSCTGYPPPAPSPVVLATPQAVCLGDDYKTPITLDGTLTMPMLTLVPTPFDASANPLSFHWSLTGSPYMVVTGTLTSQKLVVTIAGQEPLQVSLTVTNTGGVSATTTGAVAVTIYDGSVCPLGLDAGLDASDACADGDACAPGDGGDAE